jgi:hypothetical protein
MAHAPRKFVDLHVAGKRQTADELHRWRLAHRGKVPNGSATAKALNYRLKCVAALTATE